MEKTNDFYDNLILFYKNAPANEHTLELILRNLEECRKREEKLNQKISSLEQEKEFDRVNVNYNINFARETAEYYKREYYELKNRLNKINFNSERCERIDKINQGLKSECKRYKRELLNLRNLLHQNAVFDAINH